MKIDYRIDVVIREDAGTKQVASWSETITDDTMPDWGVAKEIKLASNASLQNVGNAGQFLYIECDKAITVQFNTTDASQIRIPLSPQGTSSFGRLFLSFTGANPIFVTNDSGSAAILKIITAGS